MSVSHRKDSLRPRRAKVGEVFSFVGLGYFSFTDMTEKFTAIIKCFMFAENKCPLHKKTRQCYRCIQSIILSGF